MTDLVDNYRPVQPLNGRKVYKSFEEPSIVLPGKDDGKDDTKPEESAAVRAAVGGAVLMVGVVMSVVVGY